MPIQITQFIIADSIKIPSDVEGGQNYGVNAIQPQIITTDPEGYAYLCGWVAGIAEKPHAG